MMTSTNGAVAVAALQLCSVLLLLSSAGPVLAQSSNQTQPDFPTLWDGMQINATKLYSSLSSNVAPAVATLLSQLKDPNAQMSVLGFNTDIPALCLNQFPWLAPEALHNQYLLYYVVSNKASLQGLSSSNATTLPTLMQQLSSVDRRLFLGNLTFVPAGSPGVFYVGGVQPGGIVNTNKFVTAGKGTIYTVDSCIVPPNVYIPSMLGLTIADGLLQEPSTSILHTLLMADAELSVYVSNPDNIMMLLAPDDDAFNRYLSITLQTTLDDFKGSAAAHALLNAHIIPGRPWNTGQLLQVPSWSFTPRDGSTSISITSAGRLQMQAPGNVLPALVLNGNLTIGKSIMHVISEVLNPPLPPGFRPSRPPSPAPAPAPGTYALNIRLTVPVTVDTSSQPIQDAFQSDIKQALATWFNVPPGQVPCKVQPSTGTSTGRRSLQGDELAVHGRQVLQASTKAFQVAAQVFADWSSANTATKQQLQQQLASLQANPGQLFSASVVKRYGIAASSVTANVEGSAQPTDKPPAASPSSGTPPGTPSSNDSGGGGSSNTRVVVGVVVGSIAGTVLLLLVVGCLMLHCWWGPRHRRAHRRRAPRDKLEMQVMNSLAERNSSVQGRPSDAHGVLVFSGLSGVPAPAKPAMLLSGKTSSRRNKPGLTVQGLIFGDPFLRSTAPQYSWTDRVHDDTCVRVEAHINDQQLDKFAGKAGSPVIRLTRAEVVQQIRLLNTGLLGKGASALVFKGLWPSRFGTDALLAIKVLKDPYEADPTAYESFCYEAAVLASVRHPNVLRLYGYCLELPTACLIMELLPSSLKDTLYSRARGIARQHSSLMNHSHSQTRSSVNRLAQPGQPTPTINLALGSTTGAPAGVQSSPQHGTAVQPGAVAANGVARTGKDGSGSITMQQLPAKPDATNAGGLSKDHGNTNNNAAMTLNARNLDQLAHAHTPRKHTKLDVTNLTASHASVDTPASASSAATLVSNRLTIMEVLTLASDIAAGLAYLHKRPAVVALPAHPTLMLTPDPMAGGPLSSDDSNGMMKDSESATDEDGNMSIARIVHRDLKPSNILINSRGRAKISDFGLARWHSSSTVYTHHLGVGTLRYMAPELLLGHYTQPNAHTITNRVDIYSLGMLMYEMLSQQQPWHDLTDAQIVAAVMAGLRPPLNPNTSLQIIDTSAGSSNSAERPDCNQPATFESMPQLKTLVSACWNQKDARRPTAAALQQELSMLLAHCNKDAAGALQ